jgi:hypothetical protein
MHRARIDSLTVRYGTGQDKRRDRLHTAGWAFPVGGRQIDGRMRLIRRLIRRVG